MTTSAIHTPQATAKGAVVNLSGKKLWRKQVLPLGSINYEGRQIRFDADYHKELVRNFRAGAFPQVPFQLADADNRHTNDPERTRGELVDLRAESDGLYAYVDLTSPEVVLNNPKLGVSCRILEGYTREADGKTFGKALQHVLGTLDPRVTGMKPWESVELASAQADETVDLSNQFYTKDGGAMPDGTEDKHVVELSTAQLEKLNALLAEDGGTEDGEEEIDFSGLTPEDFVDGEEDDEGDGPEAVFDVLEPGDGEDPVALAAMHNLQNQVIELTAKLDQRDNEFELEQLASTGLAPAIIEAARPLLAVDRGVIQLSNGEQVSPAKQVRKLLRTVLELSNRGMDVVSFDREDGTIQDGQDSATAVRNAQVELMNREYGS